MGTKSFEFGPGAEEALRDMRPFFNSTDDGDTLRKVLAFALVAVRNSMVIDGRRTVLIQRPLDEPALAVLIDSD